MAGLVALGCVGRLLNACVSAFRQAHIRQRLHARGLIGPFMRRLSYPVEFFYEELPSLRLERVELVTFPVRSNDGLHSFVMGRRV